MRIINIRMPHLNLRNTNTIVWCHPRSGSHNLMARLQQTYAKNIGYDPGNLYEMFPDHSALVGKDYHTEFAIVEVAERKDKFTTGLHWENKDGIIRSRFKDTWCYLDEIEYRLAMLENKEITRPTIGKHITWWNRFTEKLAGDTNYVNRVHSAVAKNSDRNIILYRQDLVAIGASMSVLALSYAESGKRRGRIRTHGQILITEEDPALKIYTDRLDRYLERLIAAFDYLDPDKTVMISTEELDDIELITWPDGESLILSNEGKEQFRSNYLKKDTEGKIKKISKAIDIVKNPTDVHKWAESAEEKYKWSTIREQSGFSKGF